MVLDDAVDFGKYLEHKISYIIEDKHIFEFPIVRSMNKTHAMLLDFRSIYLLLAELELLLTICSRFVRGLFATRPILLRGLFAARSRREYLSPRHQTFV